MNKHKGETAVEIDGEELTVVYDWEALANLSSVYGTNFDRIIVAALDGYDLKVIADVLAYGLAKHHPDWDADRIMKASPPVIPMTGVIMEAFNRAFWGPGGPPEETEPENPPSRATTTE